VDLWWCESTEAVTKAAATAVHGSFTERPADNKMSADGAAAAPIKGESSSVVVAVRCRPFNPRVRSSQRPQSVDHSFANSLPAHLLTSLYHVRWS
jgi:hypothetical protein